MSKLTPGEPNSNLPTGDSSETTPAVDAEEKELLLLALLDQLQSDYADGRHPDLAAYCVANPDLRDAFLSLALAMDPPEQEEEPPSQGDSSPRYRRGLSPGVLRALASIDEFAGDADGPRTAEHAERKAQVAEEPGKYDLKSRATSTSKGDS